MTWCSEKRGDDFHWVTELYRRLRLPITTAVLTALRKASTERIKALRRKQSEEGKKKRISQKVARREDQEERRRWTKRLALTHTYGSDDDDNDDSQTGEVESEVLLAAERVVSGNGSSIVSGRRCRCGSQSHQRTSHHSCPQNKRNKAGKVVSNRDDGSDDGDDGDNDSVDDGENDSVDSDDIEEVSVDSDDSEEVSVDSDDSEKDYDGGDNSEDVFSDDD
ncbi:transcription initiation factor TFIID subunit 11 [Exaiptasia diaphana]|uniref:Uncharacterized protein n=1 Tax=Exaiptasia diaphana TaxID=2652724 RepID=A0A913XLV6_EXADI|nr:transcription initiation factor TFIID subunit 11 [Exaiptasia diaphana]